RLERLGDDREARLLARAGEQLEALDTEPLEGVRRRPRLERAAAQHGGAGRPQPPRDGDDLLLRLDGARPRHQDDVLSADPRAVAQLDDRRLGPPLARDLLVRLRDVDHLEDTGQRFQAAAVHAAIVADQPDGRTLPAGDRPALVTHLLDHFDDPPNILLGHRVTHYDQHGYTGSMARIIPGDRAKLRDGRSGVQGTSGAGASRVRQGDA